MPAYEHNILDFSWNAGADLSTKQYYCVQLTTSETVTLADATVRTHGVLQNKPLSGEAASVCISGISRVISDGSGTAIVVGDALAPDANGIAVKTTADNDEIIGRALQASTVSGKVIAIDVTPGRRY